MCARLTAPPSERAFSTQCASAIHAPDRFSAGGHAFHRRQVGEERFKGSSIARLRYCAELKDRVARRRGVDGRRLGSDIESERRHGLQHAGIGAWSSLSCRFGDPSRPGSVGRASMDVMSQPLVCAACWTTVGITVPLDATSETRRAELSDAQPLSLEWATGGSTETRLTAHARARRPTCGRGKTSIRDLSSSRNVRSTRQCSSAPCKSSQGNCHAPSQTIELARVSPAPEAPSPRTDTESPARSTCGRCSGLVRQGARRCSGGCGRCRWVESGRR